MHLESLWQDGFKSVSIFRAILLLLLKEEVPGWALVFLSPLLGRGLVARFRMLRLKQLIDVLMKPVSGPNYVLIDFPLIL